MWAQSIHLTLQKNLFYAGERIRIRVEVLDSAGTVDRTRYGKITLKCPDLLLQVRGKNPDNSSVDMSLPDSVEVAAGINTNLFLFSWGSGSYRIDAVLEGEESIQGFAYYTSLACRENLLISEVMFRASYSNLAYIELYNNSGTALGIAGLEIFSHNSLLKPDVALLGAAGRVDWLQPGQYLVMALDSEELEKVFPDVANSGSLLMDGLLAAPRLSCNLLVYLDGVLQDTLEYASDWAEPRHSLERCAFDTRSRWRDYWQSCFAPPTAIMAHYGTPGKRNGNFIPLVPEEGRKTALEISTGLIRSADECVECVFHPTGPGRAAVELCDVTGRRIRYLVAEQDVSDVANQRFAFHAQDEQGNTLKPGIYFVVLRLLYVDLGRTEKVIRKVVVGW
jgi:hypothetical protein